MNTILKIITQLSKKPEYRKHIHEYITDPVKTGNGKYIGTIGCSHDNPLDDMFAVKKLHHKPGGRLGIHIIFGFKPIFPEPPKEKYMNVVDDFLQTAYNGFPAYYALHLDSRYLHAHAYLDSVNAITGAKFSQSPNDMCKVKQILNDVLAEHGFEITKESENDFLDCNDYSNTDGFDFLEFEKNEIITQSDLDSIILDADELESRKYAKYLESRFNPNSIYESEDNDMNYDNNNTDEQTALSTPTAEIQQSPTPSPINGLPTTTIITGPTFKIKGNSDYDMNGLSGIINQTVEYASEHKYETAKLATAINIKCQEIGYPTNICVSDGPIFDIDLTGNANNTSI